MISKQAISDYRKHTFRLVPGTHLTSMDEAVEYINQRGMIFFWPYKGIEFPSLWSAVAGSRPVADAHDDPGHVTWGWKDTLLGKKRVYYGRVLKKRNSFISMEALPYFYALSPNYGSPEEDYMIDYEAGKLTAEARAVYEALLDNGPLDTVALRKAARLTSRTSDTPFNRAMEELQVTMRVLPTGVAQAGAWNYAFIYDLVPRHLPDLIEQAHPLSEWEARRHLFMRALETLGAARQSELQRLFGWPAALVEKSVQKLAESGALLTGVEVEGMPGPCLALPGLGA
jgi:hypothetical protein